MSEATETTNIEGISGAVSDTLDLTAGIACAYVQNNRVTISEIGELLKTIHGSLVTLRDSGDTATEATIEPEIKTAAEIRKSIKPEGITSFIDGKSYKTLKRHLTKNGFTIEEYKARFGLPADYPTTAANYSAQRSALAKSLGLGQGGAKTAAAAE